MDYPVVEPEESVWPYWKLVIATAVAAAAVGVGLNEVDCTASSAEAYAFGAVSGGEPGYGFDVAVKTSGECCCAPWRDADSV